MNGVAPRVSAFVGRPAPQPAPPVMLGMTNKTLGAVSQTTGNVVGGGLAGGVEGGLVGLIVGALVKYDLRKSTLIGAGIGAAIGMLTANTPTP